MDCKKFLFAAKREIVQPEGVSFLFKAWGVVPRIASCGLFAVIQLGGGVVPSLSMGCRSSGIHLKKISGMMFKTEKQLINKEGTFDKNLKWMHWKFLTFHELKSKKYHARFSDYEREVNESTSEDDSFLGDETEKDLKVMTFDETDNIVRFWGFHQSSICPQNFKMECNILKKGMCNPYCYIDARDYLYKIRFKEDSLKIRQIATIYFHVIDKFLEDKIGKPRDLTEKNTSHKASGRNEIQRRRRKIDMRIVCRNEDIELSHVECEKVPTPCKAVNGRSSVCDKFLKDFSDEKRKIR
ncbi:hypothetical protein F8M41_026032 [Gigaspora margarita]|uniref:Uncharacterized protein n=1 Tax=Gigaspora margarita TaxID=4874 RepID=A0A8H3XJ36_GIGMA|nr:hypothetical protein F8M41_026032 [Gigaspora margarita]